MISARITARPIALLATTTLLCAALHAAPTTATARLARGPQDAGYAGGLAGDGGPTTDASKSASQGTIPPAPSGCSTATVTSSNATAMPIPDYDPAGVTSTVQIAGAGPYTYDVNVTVNISHLYPADVDVTLTSPTGTVVTLTTNNGVGNNDVFAGTVFDDQADPKSPIPYAAPPLQTVDFVYSDNVAAPALTPEEPLSAFDGANPNGTWTLKVVDDSLAALGTLNSWSLEVTTLAAAPTTSTASSAEFVFFDIPDSSPAGVQSQTTLSNVEGTVLEVDVAVAIPIPDSGDLEIALTSPDGRVVSLTTDNATSVQDAYFGRTFDDQADPGSQIPYATGGPAQAVDHDYLAESSKVSLTPEEPLSALKGADPNGTWTLKVVDARNSASFGVLNAWQLFVTTATCGASQTCSVTPAGNVVAFATTPAGAAVNYAAPTTTGACGAVTCVPASGATFPVGTTTVTCSETNTNASASFTVTVTVPFDACYVDDNTGDVFRETVASVAKGSPLYGYWQYHVAATGETFSGVANGVKYRPNLSLLMHTATGPATMTASVDYARKVALVNVLDRTTNRRFVLRDRDITNSPCPAP